MENNSEVSRLMAQTSESLMTPFMRQISHLYIDSDLLYDYYLGTLLMMISNQEQYDKVRAKLDVYATTSNPKIMETFDDLGLTQTDFEIALKNPEIRRAVAVTAPGTNLLEDLPLLIRNVNTFNQSKNVTQPVVLYINQRVMLMPPKLRAQLTQFLKIVDPNLRIIFTAYETWDQVPEDLMKKMDIIGVGDPVDFVRDGTTSQKLIAIPGTFADMIVMSHPVCTERYKDPKDEKDALHNFAAIMTIIFGKFIYLQRTVVKQEER